VSTGDGSHEKFEDQVKNLVLNFNTEEDSEEWNINHNEKCGPGGVNFGILRLMATGGLLSGCCAPTFRRWRSASKRLSPKVDKRRNGSWPILILLGNPIFVHSSIPRFTKVGYEPWNSKMYRRRESSDIPETTRTPLKSHTKMRLRNQHTGRSHHA
jgi:hypothetical protein